MGLAARHLRMLTHQLGHETHVTNEQLFAQLKFDPVPQLIKEARNNHDRLASLSSLLQPQRVVQWNRLVLANFEAARHVPQPTAHTPASSQAVPPPAMRTDTSQPSPDETSHADAGMLDSRPVTPCPRAHFAHRGDAGTGPPPPSVKLHEVTLITKPRYDCPECGISFATSGILHTHRVKMHGATTRASLRPGARLNNQVQHSTGGVPTCRHCHAEFNGWRNFNLHILLGNCPVLNAGNAAPSADAVLSSRALQEGSPHPLGHPCRDETSELVPPPPEADVSDTPAAAAFAHRLLDEAAARHLTVEQKRDWKTIASISALHSRMRNHCPVCNLWANDPSRIKVHFKAKHPALKPRLQQAEQIARGVTVQRPCTYCGQTSDVHR